MSLIRENLLAYQGYAPYCGDMNCRLGMPRTQFNGQQFTCTCGWVSGFDAAFVAEYKAKWKIK